MSTSSAKTLSLSITLSTLVFMRGRFNAAIICEYFMVELNDKSEENEKLNSSQSSKHCKAMKNHHEYI